MKARLKGVRRQRRERFLASMTEDQRAAQIEWDERSRDWSEGMKSELIAIYKNGGEKVVSQDGEFEDVAVMDPDIKNLMDRMKWRDDDGMMEA